MRSRAKSNPFSSTLFRCRWRRDRGFAWLRPPTLLSAIDFSSRIASAARGARLSIAAATTAITVDTSATLEKLTCELAVVLLIVNGVVLVDIQSTVNGVVRKDDNTRMVAAHDGIQTIAFPLSQIAFNEGDPF
jgi:hypothetical protein